MDNLPVDEIRVLSEGGPVVAVDVALSTDLARPFTYDAELSGWSILWNRVIPFRRRTPVPWVFEVIMRSLEVNFVYHSERQHDVADLLIVPAVSQWGTLQFSGYREIIEGGYQSARVAVQGWQRRSQSEPMQMA